MITIKLVLSCEAAEEPIAKDIHFSYFVNVVVIEGGLLVLRAILLLLVMIEVVYDIVAVVVVTVYVLNNSRS